MANNKDTPYNAIEAGKRTVSFPTGDPYAYGFGGAHKFFSDYTPVWGRGYYGSMASPGYFNDPGQRYPNSTLLPQSTGDLYDYLRRLLNIGTPPSQKQSSGGLSNVLSNLLEGGGAQRRYGGDIPKTGPYTLHKGEMVMSPEAVKMFGKQNLNKMNMAGGLSAIMRNI